MSNLNTDLSQHRILVVDDEADNLEVLNTTLKVLHNADVCVAQSYEEALSKLATFHPTLIITDLSMPQADGYELLKALRSRQDTGDLPIIALTAHAMKGDRERILESGFDGYIGKPFDVINVGQTLQDHLREYFIRKENAAKAASEKPAAPVAQNSTPPDPTEANNLPEKLGGIHKLI